MVARGCCEAAYPGKRKARLDPERVAECSTIPGSWIAGDLYPVVFTAFKTPATVCNPFGMKLGQGLPNAKRQSHDCTQSFLGLLIESSTTF